MNIRTLNLEYTDMQLATYMKTQRRLISIHWKEDVRFEHLKISHIGFSGRSTHLPRMAGEKYDQQLRLKFPGGFQQLSQPTP
ncbi:MAG: hypothetical protein ACLQAH_14935 [Limisphaerales bacterium]